MLSFYIRSLEARAEVVEGLVESTNPVWESDDAAPAPPGANVSGRLSSAGHGRFYFRGELEGAVVTPCRRCLRDVHSSIDEEVNFLFAESGVDEADEDDVFSISSGSRELDLSPAVREAWLLAVPQFALCMDDCKGFCPTCGADRNTGECSCSPVADPRWAGLRELRSSDA